MENNEFYIKRIKFIRNKDNSEKINNLWIICFETGDRMIKVSNYLKPIILDEFLLNYSLLNVKSLVEITQQKLNSVLWDIKRLGERNCEYDFYIKKVEYIKVPNEKIMVIKNKEPIYKETDSNKIDIGNFEEVMDFNGSVHPDNDDGEEITYDYGLFMNVNNEFKFISNSFVEYDRVLMPRNPKNINGKDKFYKVKPYRCLDTKRWEIKSLLSNDEEDDEDNNVDSLFG
tara:strand:- start:3 stop:689 length:687 start_codon:yes stop_codon:yes gene_type:complete